MEKEYDKALRRVTRALVEGNCGMAIHEMAVYLTAWPEQHTQEKLNQLQDDYDQMTSHWQRGEEDPQRETFYQQLLQRTYVLYSNVLHYHRMKASPYLYSLYTRVRQNRKDWSLAAIRQEREDFVSSVAMLQLEPEHTRKAKSDALYKTHQQQMNQLFEYVLTSRQWTDSVGRQFTALLTAPTTDSNDQQLLVSAVTMSIINQFDMAKFRMLTDVYRTSNDEAVRQRALIGWALSLNKELAKVYPEQRTIVGELLQSENVCQELTELQIQLVYCQDESKDTNTIMQEIMPDLMERSNLKMTNLGLTETEEDELESVLHPEKEDERMEQMEATFRRMMDMQKRGSDIYYGGFSQMKRYPFFYDISNWVVPFFMEHPDIQQQVARLDGNRFLQQVMKEYAFCNSDKYSFLLGFEVVINALPDSVREMLRRGEASLNELGAGDDTTPPSAMERRLAVMDLYRFFRLYPHREEMDDPFQLNGPHWNFFSNPLVAGTPLDAHKREVVRTMRKHQYPWSARQVYETFPEEMHDVEYYLWKEDYQKALLLEPENERVLALSARQCFNFGLYEEAVAKYQKLLELLPGNVRYLLNKAVCLVNMGQYDEALTVLYQLNYEHPDDLHVCRALAWALTCQGKLEQADRYYRQVMEAEEEVTGEDHHNYGCNLWLEHRIEEAAAQLRHYAEKREKKEKKDEEESLFKDDVDWLKKRGISDAEINMMETLVQG